MQGLSEKMHEGAVERKTLINAYHRLQEKADQLRKLEELAERLNEKFDRTENEPKPTNESLLKEASGKTPDLIDMFNKIADRMDYSINSIGSKTERVLNMID